MIKYLWRHVKRRPDNGLKNGIIPIIQVPGESKIADLQFSIGDEYVCRLQIAMHDIHLIHILKTSHDIFQECQGFCFWQLLSLLEVVPEVAFFAKFSDDVHVVAGLVDIQQPYDVLVLHLLHDLDLTVDVLEVVLIGEDSLVDHLYSSWAVVCEESAEED